MWHTKLEANFNPIAQVTVKCRIYQVPTTAQRSLTGLTIDINEEREGSLNWGDRTTRKPHFRHWRQIQVPGDPTGKHSCVWPNVWWTVLLDHLHVSAQRVVNERKHTSPDSLTGGCSPVSSVYGVSLQLNSALWDFDWEPGLGENKCEALSNFLCCDLGS